MAALSLTEIQSAFSPQSDDERNDEFGGAMEHMNLLPDHRKRSSPVGPRLVSEIGATRPGPNRPRRRASRRRTSGDVERFRVDAGRSGGGELNKLVVVALWITSGLATHHALTHALGAYLETQRYMSTWNRVCIVFIYPVSVILVLHYLKTRR